VIRPLLLFHTPSSSSSKVGKQARERDSRGKITALAAHAARPSRARRRAASPHGRLPSATTSMRPNDWLSTFSPAAPSLGLEKTRGPFEASKGHSAVDDHGSRRGPIRLENCRLRALERQAFSPVRTEHASVCCCGKYLFPRCFLPLLSDLAGLPPAGPSVFPCAGHVFCPNIPPGSRVGNRGRKSGRKWKHKHLLSSSRSSSGRLTITAD
jgi:hypothetical protein